jgi:tetratricopeptide (TPR) repeat protein
VSDLNLKRLPPLAWIIPALIAVVVYFATMCRTVYVGDSGEFALVFKTLGIAHPPGYPLFTLLGHVFVALTAFFSPAFSANLFSVLIAAALLPVLVYLVKETGALLAGILALLWAFSPLYWGETVGVEVYTLNLLFIAGISALALNLQPKKWCLIAYFFGLSLAHHLTSLALIPALGYAFFGEKTARSEKQSLIYLVLLLLGLSIYFYLPVRAGLSPLADWGHPSSLNLLLNHITAAQYQQAAAFSLVNLLQSFRLFFSLFLDNWSWPGVAVLLLGTATGWKSGSRRIRFAWLLLLSNVILVAFYRIPDIDPYYLPALLAGWMLIAEGVLWLISAFSSSALRRGVYALAGAAVIGLFALHFTKIDRSGTDLARQYGEWILDTAGAGTVFTRDDNASFASLYLRYAEGYHPEVEVYDQASRLFALAHAAGRLTGGIVPDYQTARRIFLQHAPGLKHLVKMLYPYDSDWMTTDIPLYSNGILISSEQPAREPVFPQFVTSDVPDDFKSRQILINSILILGESYLRQSPPDSARALFYFKKALADLQGEPRAALLNQLGISFRHLRMEDLALQAYNFALQAPRLDTAERAEILFNISNIYKDRGNRLAAAQDLRGALDAFLAALQYDPVNSGLLYNIGVLYVNYLNDPVRGIPYLESYLRLNPQDTKVRDLINSRRR